MPSYTAVTLPEQRNVTETNVPVLVLEVCERLCALELRDVVETMRPLPVQPVSGAPAYVRGLAVIRGQPTPVVELAVLLTGTAAAHCTRFVHIRVDQRPLALAVSAVRGIRSLSSQSLQGLPPLLAAAQASGLESLALLDSELLAVLATGRLLPAAAWQELGELACPA